jgi:putative peptide zinc metalloprotease protein
MVDDDAVLPPSRRRPLVACDPVPARLADGVEPIGAFQGSARRDTPYLVRRGDGRMVELSPLLYVVVSSLDGHRQFPEIAASASAAVGRHISADNVEYLVDHKLRPLQLVAGTSAHRPAPSPPSGLLGLQLRFGVLPPPLVRAVATVLRPLFAPIVVVTALTSLVAVDAWLVLHDRVHVNGAAMVQRPGMLLSVAGLTVLAGAFHELGHATATRYGGAEPGVIGAGVYLVWPVFYNDLNDSYRLSRGGRLRADLGGVYFNVVFILGLMAAHALTGSGLLLLAALLQHVVIVQQFLPFVRLDGYYIVSDLAGVPDLFGSIRPILSSLVPGRAPEPVLTGLRTRARWIVTVWVVVTVPLLLILVALFVRSAPHLVGAAWRTLVDQTDALLGSIWSADLGGAVLSGVRATIAAAPLVGLAIPVLRVAHRRAPWGCGSKPPTAGRGRPGRGARQGLPPPIASARSASG